MELAQAGEESFFVYVVQRDIDDILLDIREAHRTDTTAADTASDSFQMIEKLPDLL